MGRGFVFVSALMGFILSGSGCITLDELVLRPTWDFPEVPTDWGYAFEEVTLPVSEDRSIVVWHIPAAEPKALIIIIPGMSHNKARYLEALPLWIRNMSDPLKIILFLLIFPMKFWNTRWWLLMINNN